MPKRDSSLQQDEEANIELKSQYLNIQPSDQVNKDSKTPNLAQIQGIEQQAPTKFSVPEVFRSTSEQKPPKQQKTTLESTEYREIILFQKHRLNLLHHKLRIMQKSVSELIEELNGASFQVPIIIKKAQISTKQQKQGQLIEEECLIELLGVQSKEVKDWQAESKDQSCSVSLPEGQIVVGNLWPDFQPILEESNEGSSPHFHAEVKQKQYPTPSPQIIVNQQLQKTHTKSLNILKNEATFNEQSFRCKKLMHLNLHIDSDKQQPNNKPLKKVDEQQKAPSLQEDKKIFQRLQQISSKLMNYIHEQPAIVESPQMQSLIRLSLSLMKNPTSVNPQREPIKLENASPPQESVAELAESEKFQPQTHNFEKSKKTKKKSSERENNPHQINIQLELQSNAKTQQTSFMGLINQESQQKNHYKATEKEPNDSEDLTQEEEWNSRGQTKSRKSKLLQSHNIAIKGSKRPLKTKPINKKIAKKSELDLSLPTIPLTQKFVSTLKTKDVSSKRTVRSIHKPNLRYTDLEIKEQNQTQIKDQGRIQLIEQEQVQLKAQEENSDSEDERIVNISSSQIKKCKTLKIKKANKGKTAEKLDSYLEQKGKGKSNLLQNKKGQNNQLNEIIEQKDETKNQSAKLQSDSGAQQQIYRTQSVPPSLLVIDKPHSIQQIANKLTADQTVQMLSIYVKGTNLGKVTQNMIVLALKSCKECKLISKTIVSRQGEMSTVNVQKDVFIFKQLNNFEGRFNSFPKSNSKHLKQYSLIKNLELEKIGQIRNVESFLFLPINSCGQEDEKSKAVDFILLSKNTHKITIVAINITVDKRKDRIYKKITKFVQSYSKFIDKSIINIEGTPIELHFAVLKFENVQIELEELKTQLDQKFKNSLAFERQSDYFVVKSEDNESIMLKTVRIFNLGDLILLQRQTSEQIKIFQSFHKKLLEEQNYEPWSSSESQQSDDDSISI